MIDADPAVLDEAVAAGREAVALTSEADSRLPQFLEALCLALEHVDRRTGKVGAETLESARRAVRLTGEGQPRRGRHLSLLAAVLRRRGADGDLEEATEIAREAVAAARGRSEFVAVAEGFGLIAETWSRTAPGSGLPAEAIALLTEAVALPALPGTRLTVARLLARLQSGGGQPRRGRWPPWRRPWTSSPRSRRGSRSARGRERMLEQSAGIADEVMWTGRQRGRARTCGRTRGDDPGPAPRGVDRGAWAADRGASASGRGVPPAARGAVRPGRAGRGRPQRGRRRPGTPHGHAGRMGAAPVDRARAARPGRVPALRPAYAELRRQAADGPIVLVSLVGAVVVRPDGTRAVLLPDLSPDDVARWTGHLAGESSVEDLDVMCAWLWDTAARPILDALGPAPGSRLWWCPVGALAALPFHAAGRHTEDGQSVLDRVVSSYTPTIRALAHARSRRAAAAGGAVAEAVVVRSEAGGPRLKNTRAEIATITELLPGARVLEGPGAHRDAVLGALRDASVAHFACHAENDPDAPSRSRIMLADHADAPLTVETISRLDLGVAQLAYLSACGTGQTRLKLSDEASPSRQRLPAGRIPAGDRHSVAVHDRMSRQVAERVYRAAVRSGRLEPDLVPSALHEAGPRAAREPARGPALWAGFVHYGV